MKKSFLSSPGPYSSGGARTAAHHLPEFGLGPNHFEEDEVDDVRYVDASVQHVYRNGDVGIALGGQNWSMRFWA